MKEIKIKVNKDEVTGLKVPYDAFLIEEKITDLGCPNQKWVIVIETKDGKRYTIKDDDGRYSHEVVEEKFTRFKCLYLNKK